MSAKFLKASMLLVAIVWANTTNAATPENNHSTTPSTKAATEAPSLATLDKWVAIGKNYFYGGTTFYSKDYTKALEWFQKAAEYNHPEALYCIANAYHDGLGVEQDEDRANVLYRRAARKGQTDSQMIIGVLYIFEGAKKETDSPAQMKFFKEAAKWLKPASEKGHPEAQFWYGDMLIKGSGVAKNETEGMALLRKSAEQNNANGQGMLAAYYLNGTVVKKDPIEAMKWALLSEAGGNENAPLMKLNIAKELTESEAQIALKAAQTWLETHKIKKKLKSLTILRKHFKKPALETSTQPDVH